MCRREPGQADSDIGIKANIKKACSFASTYRYHLAALGGIAFCTAVALRDPRIDGNYPACPWLALTGTYCPGCGTMRAINRLMNFDLAGAIDYNIATVMLVPVVCYMLFTNILPKSFSTLLPELSRIDSRYINGLAFFMIAFWFARNIPFEPFNWLAPPL